MKKTAKQKKERLITLAESLRLGEKIRRESRKTIKLPANFDIVKFIHKCR